MPIGVYRGLKFGLILHPQWRPEIYLEGQTIRQESLSREHQGPRAVLNALDRLANDYSHDCSRAQQDLSVAEAQLRDYRERLGKPFVHEEYLAELTALRDRLKIGLSGNPKEGEPTTAELAEQIKTLRAGQIIEATPQRMEKRQLSAEVPVTARIMRRAEENAGKDDRGEMKHREKIVRELRAGNGRE